MSRTKRNYPWWIDWLDNFDKKLERGHVSMPKPEIFKGKPSRGRSSDEVWGPGGKRSRKRFLTRKRRREGKADSLREQSE